MSAPADVREPLLELKGVDTHYGPIQVLNGVDMVIYPGEMVCLLGGNASGKSTTLRILAGLESPESEEIRSYLDYVLSMPWMRQSAPPISRHFDAASSTSAWASVVKPPVACTRQG